MRRLAALSFVLLMCALTASADDTSGRSFVLRSEHYEITLGIEPLPSGQIAYEARVKDRMTGGVLAQPRATSSETDVELSGENGGLTFMIHVHLHPQSLLAEFEVRRDGGIVEKVTTGWNFPTDKHLVAPGALHVEGDVKAPVVVTRIEPLYPEAARKDRIAGVVILEILIDKSGSVADAMVLQNLPDGLGQAAMDAVKQWKFKPATMNGEPVDVIFNVTMNFKPR
jgi:TonB family protein